MSSDEQNPPAVEEIEIRSLFGWLDHSIRLLSDQRITILHGPNGVGKTTILQLIHSLFSQNLDSILQISFSQLRISFSDQSHLEISKRDDGDEPVLELELRQGRKKIAKAKFPDHKPITRKRFVARRTFSESGPIRLIGPDRWLHKATDEILTTYELSAKYPGRYPKQLLLELPEFDPTIANRLSSMNVHFIETQRLFYLEPLPRTRHPEHETTLRPTIEQLAVHMSGKVQDTLRESGALTASLDRTFPARLLQEKPPSTATEESIRSTYEHQKLYRNRLMQAGLLEVEELVDLPSENLDDAELRVLWHYLEDVEKKFQKYDDILNRIELFLDIINNKGFLRKKLVVDKKFGFYFTTKSPHGEKVQRVPLSSLSSGEQHEVILVYQLLFEAEARSLILIDEPELSLHVTWQHSFLDDLEKISQVANLDFLIATHSPSIVRDRRDLMVALQPDNMNHS